jgi:hypothetical protein
MIIPVALSSDAGNRLRPPPRAPYPQPSLPLTGERSPSGSFEDHAALVAAKPRTHGDPALCKRRQTEFALPRFADRKRACTFKTTGSAK